MQQVTEHMVMTKFSYEKIYYNRTPTQIPIPRDIM